MKGRVVIVTPGPIGSNPRVVKEADALHSAGYQVSVVSTRTVAAVDQRDEALMARIDWNLERIDLRSRRSRLFNRIVQVAARRIWSASGLSLLATRAFSEFTPALARVVLDRDADLYIAHYPAALAVAHQAALRHGARYAYDAEDFHLDDWPQTAMYESERRLLRKIEGRYLPGCAYVTAASPAIADEYSKTYGVTHPTVVLNAFPLERGPRHSTAKGSAAPGPSIYWFSQTVGPDRGLECAVQAIGLSSSRPHLYLRGRPVPGFEETLEALARQAGVTGHVHLLPPAAPDDMERLAAHYDVGLCSETATANRGLALTNKLFTYLVAGIAPLMSATPAQQRFADEAGLSDLVFPIDDAAALAKLLDDLLGSVERLSEARARAFRCAEDRYNWGKEQHRFLDSVGQVLASAGAHSTRQTAASVRGVQQR